MGQIGSAMRNSNTFAPDPSGFSGSEMAARFIGGAGKGALQGFSGMEQQKQQRGGGGQANPQPFMQPDGPSANSLIPQGQVGDVYQQPGVNNARRRNAAFYGS